MIPFPSLPRRKKKGETLVSPASGDTRYRNREQHIERSYRFIGLIILTLIGIWLLGSIARPATGRQTHSATSHAVTPSLSSISGSSSLKGTQMGGVDTSDQKTQTQRSAIPAFCLPTDVNCLLNGAAQWAAQGILGVFQPVIDAIDQNSLNFITQTPLCVSACPTNDSPYQQNATIAVFVNWSVGVVDAAVAVFVVLGGYNIMIARQIGASYHEVAEFIPRLALAVMAANLCLFFLQFFIDLENALCLEVSHLFALTVLTNTIIGIFNGNLLSGGLLLFALAIVLGVMNLLLIWQMLVRLALLFVVIVLAPLGLLCFGLPQTQEYGRMWSSTFSVTLFIQFFQVVTLALGGMLISYVQATNLLQLDQAVLSLLASTAVIFLVLRIPSMIRNWALRPIVEAGMATERAAGGAAEYAAGVATRLIAAFA